MVTGIDCPNISYDLPVLSNKSVIFLFANSISALVFVCFISEFYDIQTELKHCGESSIYLCVDSPQMKRIFHYNVKYRQYISSLIQFLSIFNLCSNKQLQLFHSPLYYHYSFLHQKGMIISRQQHFCSFCIIFH